EVRTIFGSVFKGSRTPSESLTAVVRWAGAAGQYSQLLAAILIANKAVEARSRIREVLTTERIAEEILARVSATAKIDPRHFTDGCSWREIAQRLHRAARDAD